MDDEGLLRLAIELAEQHSRQGRNGPFGAVVARGGDIVGQGWNQVVSSGDPTAHAEVVAIRDACRRIGSHRLEDCTIYCSCEPCPMCLAAIHWARIGRVVYAAGEDDARRAGFDDGEIRRELTLEWEGRRILSRRLLAGEGADVLERWSGMRDKAEY